MWVGFTGLSAAWMLQSSVRPPGMAGVQILQEQKSARDVFTACLVKPTHILTLAPKSSGYKETKGSQYERTRKKPPVRKSA